MSLKRMPLSRFPLLVADGLVFCLSYILSYLLRFDLSISYVVREYSHQIPYMIPFICVFKLTLFYLFGLYRRMWRYTSLGDFWTLLQANIFSELTIIAFIGFIHHFQGFPRSVFLLDGMVCFLLTGGVRVITRSYYLSNHSPLSWIKEFFSPPSPHEGKRVLIIGAGGAGEKVAREIMEDREKEYTLVGFVDDDSSKIGRLLHGVPVVGSIDLLPEVVERYGVEEVFIAVPSATGEEMRRIVSICKGTGVRFKTLPAIKELLEGKVSISALRDVSYEDLLGRSPVRLDSRGIRGYLMGKTILITGAGGSIGSELCRQILRFEPGLLILLDSSEANLYSIEMELKNEFRFFRYVPLLGSVQDLSLLERTFETYSPSVVFHAAAYKHVPMLEINPWEAVFNNIVGTRCIMEVSSRWGVERFVLVSTDKAVRPTNVMGASKRVSELLMFSFNGGASRFMAVRFGNVVGSSGSVIPLFKRQIQRGGPVTVTHPEVTRYFMTISEASQLILQAGSMGEGGEIFILDMGTPVKIVEMARDLIRLSGKEPGRDIEIVFTGLRPGEKLYEELITQGEGIVKTAHHKILVLKDKGEVVREDFRSWLYHHIEELVACSKRFDSAGIRHYLKLLVPEYTPSDTQSVLDRGFVEEVDRCG